MHPRGVALVVVILLINIPPGLVQRSRSTAHIPRERYYLQENMFTCTVHCLHDIHVISCSYTHKNYYAILLQTKKHHDKVSYHGMRQIFFLLQKLMHCLVCSFSSCFQNSCGRITPCVPARTHCSNRNGNHNIVVTVTRD